MAIAPDKLAQIIKHNSAGLCNSQGDSYIQAITSNTPLRESQAYPQGFSQQDDNEDYWGIPEMPSRRQQNLDGYTNEQVSRSGLPDSVKQSLMNERIKSSQPSTVVDALGIDTDAIIRERMERRQATNPTTNNAPQFGTSANIDYSLIKSIVTECISSYFKEHGEDNTLKAIKLVNGTIKLIDNSGNIFSAKLEKKGNVNDKK